MTHILALDQGTTSTRAIVFDHAGRSVSAGQLEHRQIFPHAGWVEHDAMEIWHNTQRATRCVLPSTANRRATMGRSSLGELSEPSRLRLRP